MQLGGRNGCGRESKQFSDGSREDRYHSVQGFFLAEKGMELKHKLAVAIGVCAVDRVGAQTRARGASGDATPLLRLHAREGLRGAKARKTWAEQRVTRLVRFFFSWRAGRCRAESGRCVECA